jgi:hypothetical protein
LNDELDDEYHVSILDVKTRKIIGKENKFRTLEEVLGFLHKLEEEKIREEMFTCLMGLRDGVSEVTINRKFFHAGNQILQVKPPERFQKLFWEGTGEFKQ